MDLRTLMMCITASLVPMTAATASEVSDRLRDQLGAATYEAAGLDLLSEEEQAVLDSWIAQRLNERAIPMPAATVSYSSGRSAMREPPAAVSVGAAQNATQAAAQESSQPADRARNTSQFGIDFAGSDSMRSVIDGDFSGWDGGTVFRLRNGTVWEQADSTRLVVPNPVIDPEVVIERSYFGYRMKVEGYNRRVQVRRVE